MKINPNIAISENGLLFNPATGESYSTNPIGAEIITLMKKDFLRKRYGIRLWKATTVMPIPSKKISWILCIF